MTRRVVTISVCVSIFLLVTPAKAESDAGGTTGNSSASTPTQPQPDQPKADRIVVYSASWCPPCRKLKPILQSLEDKGYQITRHDVDKDSDRLKYRYSKLPTIFFLSNDEIVRQESGYRDAAAIQDGLLPPPRLSDLVVRRE